MEGEDREEDMSGTYHLAVLCNVSDLVHRNKVYKTVSF